MVMMMSLPKPAKADDVDGYAFEAEEDERDEQEDEDGGDLGSHGRVSVILRANVAG
jgi:hypothetical protein